MTLGATDIVIVASLIGISLLALVVLLSLLILGCMGFRGCLQCGSELSNGAGKCLMCGQAWRTPLNAVNEPLEWTRQRLARGRLAG
jgi:hypothetical protein